MVALNSQLSCHWYALRPSAAHPKKSIRDLPKSLGGPSRDPSTLCFLIDGRPFTCSLRCKFMVVAREGPGKCSLVSKRAKRPQEKRHCMGERSVNHARAKRTCRGLTTKGHSRSVRATGGSSVTATARSLAMKTPHGVL